MVFIPAFLGAIMGGDWIVEKLVPVIGEKAASRSLIPALPYVPAIIYVGYYSIYLYHKKWGLNFWGKKKK